MKSPHSSNYFFSSKLKNLRTLISLDSLTPIILSNLNFSGNCPKFFPSYFSLTFSFFLSSSFFLLLLSFFFFFFFLSSSSFQSLWPQMMRINLISCQTIRIGFISRLPVTEVDRHQSHLLKRKKRKRMTMRKVVWIQSSQ